MSEELGSEELLRELQEQLREAGTKLLNPPTPVDELLGLLDHVENLLSRVEQSPGKSMQDAISPLTGAVILDAFLRHSNVDVKVAVASCISEITRITAPDAPYDDDKMKDVFQLIVSAFEDLSDQSSRSYNKRVMILETVAKVRSCVVMLDLECDALIVKMFKHFLANIRDYHPENIFSSMVTIMTLVLDESEDISSAILTPMLTCLKKGNQEILPVAVKLSEKVFEKCAVKLQPYLREAIQSLEDYTEVVTVVCGGPLAATEHTNENVSANSLVQKNVGEAISMDADENVSGLPNSIDADENVSGPADSAMAVSDNGKENIGTGLKVEASVYAREKDQDNEPSAEKLVSKSEDDESESKLEGVDTTTRGGKPNSSIDASESSDTSHIDGEKEVENQLDSQELLEKDPHHSLREENAMASPDMEVVKNNSSPKAADTSAAIIASPSQSEGLHDDERPKKAGRRKNKERSVQEETPSLDLTSKKASKESRLVSEKERSVQEETPSLDLTSKKASKEARDKDAKLSRSTKKASLQKKSKITTNVDTSKNESEGESGSENKQLGKKMDESSNTKDEYSVGKSVESKRRRKTKPASEKEATKTSDEDDLKKTPSTKSSSKLSKDTSSPEETPRMIAKRKLAASQQKAAENNLDASLVGTKVKVWWPEDKKYYEGVIDSYDRVNKKHKVLYKDGDEELLLLKKEKWEIINDDTVSSEGQAAVTRSAEAASGSKKREKAKMVKPDNSPKSGGASSRKGKGSTAKHVAKAESGSESESGGNNDDDKVVRSKSQRSGDKTSKDAMSKGKSKSGSKLTPKVGSKSKGKSGDDGKTRSKEKESKTIGGKIKLSERSKESEGSSAKKRRRIG